MTTQIIATAANLNPECCCAPPRVTILRWRQVFWWATAGGISRPGVAPAAVLSSIGNGYGENPSSDPDVVVSTLSEAAAWILAQNR